ncbi:MAG TPA: hypothetical protein PKH39_18920 [Woeseiaceae bacterium]|nr:hypothetical protein [Woeseiaceae bacterium]
MSRNEVCALFDEPPHAFMKTPASQSETFKFGDGSIFVYFDSDTDTVEFIELASSGHGSWSIDGIDVFITTADDLLEKLAEKYGLRIEEGGCSVILEGQDISLWRSDAESTYFDAVGVGAPDYFATD